MADTTTIRISRDTHARVTRLAAERHETIDETVRNAIRALRQDAMARDLADGLTEDETAWLDADAG
jgi:predicted transcriptional regulator